MGDVPVTGYQNIFDELTLYTEIRISDTVQQYPEADAQLKQLLKVMDDIEDVARHIPASVGESAEWAAIVNAAEENGASYRKGLQGNSLFSALYATSTVTLEELKDMLRARTLANQTNSPKQQGSKQRRRMVSKKNGGGSGAPTTKPPELQRD
jgi:hypothetical protein